MMSTPAIFEDRALAVAAARAAHDKGATDVKVIDVGGVLRICGYFVVASAANPRLVKAVTDAVEEALTADFDVKPRTVEGMDGRRWVLMDYGDIAVHVFDDEEREFYRLERLYSDAPTVEWEPTD